MNKEEKMLRLVKNPRILKGDELIEQTTTCSPNDSDDKEDFVQWVKDSLAAIDCPCESPCLHQPLPAGQRFKHCPREVYGNFDSLINQLMDPGTVSATFTPTHINITTAAEHLTDAVGHVLPNPYKEENEEE